MRLWSLDPAYLDSKGLVALWREGLLARAVLRGATRGYRRHPQLTRFLAHPAPVSAINHYLAMVATDAGARGFSFDRSRLGPVRHREGLRVTSGQLAFEMDHLRRKLQVRDPAALACIDTGPVRAHPLFTVEPGPIATWERGIT